MRPFQADVAVLPSLPAPCPSPDGRCIFYVQWTMKVCRWQADLSKTLPYSGNCVNMSLHNGF